MLADYETRILAQIDDMVEHATDDELFAGGYLQGHLTLAVAELEQSGDHSVEALLAGGGEYPSGNQCQELTPPDQVLVLETWKRLLQTAQEQE